MADIQTSANDASVEEFLNNVENEQKRRDCIEIAKMMQRVTKKKPKMWGPAIIGFGNMHYKYESGHEGDMPQIAFAPRKHNITLYIGVGDDSENPLLKKLGKYTTGKVCLYIKKLADVDTAILQKVIAEPYERVKRSGSALCQVTHVALNQLNNVCKGSSHHDQRKIAGCRAQN